MPAHEPRDLDTQTHPTDSEGADAVLVARIQQGDEVAYRALFERYVDRLVDFAFGFTGVTETAEDIVNDVLFAIWRGRVAWAPQRVETYLFGAVRNRCHTYHAQLQHRREVELPGTSSVSSDDPHETHMADLADSVRSAEELIDEADLLARVARVLDTLPTQRKAAAILRWREGLSVTEIAAILQTSENGIRIQLTRAMRAIREQLGGLFQG